MERRKQKQNESQISNISENVEVQPIKEALPSYLTGALREKAQ